MERPSLSADGGLRRLVTVPVGAKKLAQREAICAISAKKLAQHEVMCAISTKKLAQHAIKHSFWAILPALGECFRAIVIDRLRWANFLAPMPLTAPRDETVSTIAGASVRLHETHNAFAR